MRITSVSPTQPVFGQRRQLSPEVRGPVVAGSTVAAGSTVLHAGLDGTMKSVFIGVVVGVGLFVYDKLRR